MYKIFLSGIEGLGSGWRLPINPFEKFNVSLTNKFDKVDVFKLGEVILKRHKSLQTFGWESFLPSDPEMVRVFSGIENYQCDPVGQALAFKNAENSIINLVITLPDEREYINIDVILSKFTTIDKGGIPGDIYYEIELTEFKEPIVIPTPQFYNNTGTVEGMTKTQYIEDTSGASGEEQPISQQIGIGDYIEYSGKAYEQDMSRYFSDNIEKGKSVFKVNPSIYLEETKDTTKQVYNPYTQKNQEVKTKEVAKNYVLQNITGEVIEIKEGKSYDNKIGFSLIAPTTKDLDYDGIFYKIKLTEGITKSDPLSQIGASLLNFAIGIATKGLAGVSVNNKINEIWAKGETSKKIPAPGGGVR